MMNKYNLILIMVIGLVFISCNQDKKTRKIICENNFISDAIYNDVINSRYLGDSNDTLAIDNFLSGYNNLANYGLYKVKLNDTAQLNDLYLYIRYIYLDTNSQKSLMMSNKERDTRKICFYLYNNVLSYSDDYVRNEKITFNDVEQIIEDYYLNDSIHLMFSIYNRSKGVELKYHISAGEDELKRLLTKMEMSYINVIDKFCYKQFGEKISKITDEQLLTLKDSLYFNTSITVSRSITGSFDVYN